MACRDMREADGAIPRCESAEGCFIPPLEAEESRVLQMRALLIRLRGIASPEAVLGTSGATMAHLRLMAYVEEIMEEVPANDTAEH